MHILKDDLTSSNIALFLEEHIREMRAVSPPESKHALDLEGLRKPEVSFWTAWDGDCIVGCGALKDLGFGHGEIKSMRTRSASRNAGVASTLLKVIVKEARAAGFRRLSLETGSQPFFEPARKFYVKFGFVECKPFANYKEDVNSVFMTKDIENHPADSDSRFLIVEPGKLAAETLTNLAREFVLREQANDDPSGSELDDLVKRAVGLIKAKKLFITFDSHSESVGVVDPARHESSFLKPEANVADGFRNEL